MNQETKTCQNCKKSFIVEPEDFAFYEKMEVPPPSFCPDCRFQRRLAFRNERSLYKRTCDLCKKNIISDFSPEKPYKVYCNPCWWSDEWDGLNFAQEYDQSRPFLEQFRELQLKVPYMALVVDYPTLINSEYVNYADNLKNCYLSFDTSQCDNVHYSKTVFGLKDSMECRMTGESELCYEDIDCGKSNRVFFSEACESCHDIYFSKNLTGCSSCFSCINLTNKQYHIFNQPYSREDYAKKLKEFRLHTFSGLEKAKAEAEKFWLGYPVKFAHARHNVSCTGDYIFHSKNAKMMYQARMVEEGKFTQFISMPAKDVYDYTEWGKSAQRIYDSITVGMQADNIKFSHGCWENVMGIEYSMYVLSSSNVFGSIGLRKKSHCILNKQYTQEEFEKFRSHIIKDMHERPYVDANGRSFSYGEFFPYDLSLFDYNETTAMEYFPLSKEETVSRGLRWREPTFAEYQVTIREVPNSIHDVDETIVKEVLECMECKRPFRIIQAELQLLYQFELPLPRKCPECRHRERATKINQPNFYHRPCMCGGTASQNGLYENLANHPHGADPCPNEFETSYVPERPEIVYCEVCYQSEIQ